MLTPAVTYPPAPVHLALLIECPGQRGNMRSLCAKLPPHRQILLVQPPQPPPPAPAAPSPRPPPLLPPALPLLLPLPPPPPSPLLPAAEHALPPRLAQGRPPAPQQRQPRPPSWLPPLWESNSNNRNAFLAASSARAFLPSHGLRCPQSLCCLRKRLWMSILACTCRRGRECSTSCSSVHHLRLCLAALAAPPAARAQRRTQSCSRARCLSVRSAVLPHVYEQLHLLALTIS